MTTTAPAPPAPPAAPPARGATRVRPRQFTTTDWLVLGGAAVSSLALTWVVCMELTNLRGAVGFAVIWYGLFILTYWLVALDLHGRLVAVDRVMTVLVGSAALAVFVPLVTIIAVVAVKGLAGLTKAFFTQTLATTGPLDPIGQGGALHAIVGTLMQVAIATILAVPLGFLTAVYLNEVGGRLTWLVRFLVDALSGLPSIVAGLFVLAIWIIGLKNGYSGWAAALALAMLMLPTVTRTSEVVLRLVPGGLREASLAPLGAPEWRTAWNVVLPTARAGLVTAVILGVARAVGETAPLLMTAFGSTRMNLNPFSGPQASLPLYVYTLYRSPEPVDVLRAWTGALALVMLVLILFTVARVASRRGTLR